MFKFLLIAVVTLLPLLSSAQDSNSWVEYYANSDIRFETRFSDCSYPEKGVHNRYVLFRITNLTRDDVSLEYELARSYNGKELKADVESFQFELAASDQIQSDCDKLTPGLHLFSKMLNVDSKSVLSEFKIREMRVNGKTVEQ